MSDGRVAASRICLNAVYVKPYRAVDAEECIEGKSLTEENAAAAGAAAVSSAKPMTHNAYMVQIAKALVTRALLDCR